jgi:hypothetical protein
VHPRTHTICVLQVNVGSFYVLDQLSIEIYPRLTVMIISLLVELMNGPIIDKGGV